MSLPVAAKQAYFRDRSPLGQEDPGTEAVIRANIEWLCRAQDCSSSKDGGVARDYSLVDGWATSYPETTGYIVPTLLHCAERYDLPELRGRARLMLDWLVSIQLPDGGFQGGKIDASPVQAVTFNTGQILLGLAAGAQLASKYERAAERAATWLRDSLDDDGCWRRFATPFAKPGDKTYETHVSWGLFEADRVLPERGFGEAGLKQVRWALSNQHDNGWLGNCCLLYPDRPLTHTLGYALRGFLEAYDFSGEKFYLDKALVTAKGLLSALRLEDGYLPGRLDSTWRPAVEWTCLTGSVQVAYCWLQLYRITGDDQYRIAGNMANQFVRRTIEVSGRPETSGGVKGSYPISGSYGKYQYLNWAAKFNIDANILEEDIRASLPP